jgi:nucleotidyltransferase/DNA polymerase involved in DNA repair
LVILRKLIFINHKDFFLRALATQKTPSAAVAVVRDGVVLEASPKAKAVGVAASITKTLAQRRCPDLLLVEFDAIKCYTLYEQVWMIYAQFTPQVEPATMHQGFLDVTGCGRGWRSIQSFMQHVQARLTETTGVTCEWGGGRDRWIAKLACGENSFVLPENEAEFLQRVPTARLLRNELSERLLRYSVRTVADLIALPRHFIETHLQISAQQFQSLLIRDVSRIRCLFPPPRLEVEVDVDWLHPEEPARAVDELSGDVERLLREQGWEAGRLKAEFISQNERQFGEITPSHPLHSADQIRHILVLQIAEKHLRRLQRIHLWLDRLMPRTHWQTDLWHDPMIVMKQNVQFQQIQETVRVKFGGSILQSGREFAKLHRPRFAQLIYGQRGIYLP